MRRLEGKVAIITGAGCVAPGWGNGRAAAVLFAKEGATVIGTDINTDAMEETARMLREIGGAHHLAHCDVTDSSSIAGMVEDVMSRYGRVDVLVNNVGGSAKGGAVEFRVEKAGILHAGVGKASFSEQALLENIKAFADAVSKAKPSGAKGTYVKRVAVSSTMGPGVHVDPSSVH